MNRYIKLMIISLITFISLIAVGCGDNPVTPTNTTPPTTIEIYTDEIR